MGDGFLDNVQAQTRKAAGPGRLRYSVWPAETPGLRP